METLLQSFGAIDIGGTKIAVGIVTETGRLVASEEFPTDPHAGPASAIDRITNALASTGATLQAIGIACTGPVDPLSGKVGEVALLPGWQGFPLASSIEEKFQVPAALENDCDAAALAEAQWGSGAGLTRFLFVSLSTGIGAGLILDGQIYRGANGTHPELGHMTIDPSGPLCYCGSHGCWESLASGTAISDWHSQQTDSTLRLNAQQIFALARTGDSTATKAVQRFTRYLGIGLGNLVTLYAPQRIALGGGLMLAEELFLTQAQVLAIARSGLIPSDTVSIVPAALGTNAGLIGAAAIAQFHLKREIIS